MKKGISAWAFPAGTPLEECFVKAKKMGFDGVELALEAEGELTPETTKEEAMKIKAAADKAGIELYSICTGLYWGKSYVSPSEEDRKTAKYYTERQLELASWLGCDTILVVPGTVTEEVEYDDAYELALKTLKELAPFAEKCGVSIGVENVWNKFLLSPMEMAEFIDKVGSDCVGAYFDVGNVLINGFPQQWIKILGKRIRKVHFKDFKVSTKDFVDMLEGDVNYPAVMEAFAKAGYDGWVTGEMFPTSKDYPDIILHSTSVAMDMILGR